MEPVPTFDLYAELEVSPSATTPTIDAAWKSLMKRNHPDVGGARPGGRTVRLNIAHDWLADPARRTRYDEALRARNGEAHRAAGPGRVPPAAGPVPAQPSAAAPRSARWSPPPVRAKPRQPHATRARRARGRWREGPLPLLLAVGVLAVVGGFGIRVVLGGPGPTGTAGSAPGAGAAATAETPRPTTSPAAVSGAFLSAAPSTTGSPADPPPSSTPGRPAPSTRPVLTLTGAGDHGGVPVTLAGGRYEVSYDVSSDAGGSCPWALYLTGSNGLDLLMASAYPVDETLRAAESDSFIAQGNATVRVESGCPHWSATISRTGP